VEQEGVQAITVEGGDGIGVGEAEALVEVQGGLVGGVDVEDERGTAIGDGHLFHGLHELAGESLTAVGGGYVERDDVTDVAAARALHVEDAEASELPFGFCDDGAGVLSLGKAAHGGTAEAKGSFEADVVERDHGVEVGRCVGAEVHEAFVATEVQMQSFRSDAKARLRSR
jgi:hypothetical protein